MFIKGSVDLQELISVIIPVYNVEKYLKRCVDSVINQTYKNLEIILVDDGSPDNCGAICDEYAERDNRIKVIHKENGGLSSARNAGIDVASGTYLSFIDSDDYVSEQFIEKLYSMIKEYDADISQCNFVRTKGEVPETKSNNTPISVCDNVSMIENLYNEHYVPTVVVVTKLYHSKLFDGIRYPEGRVHEDEVITPLVLYKSNRCVFSTEALYYYYFNENSITNSQFSVKKLDILYALNSRISFYMENGLRKYALLDLGRLSSKCWELYKLTKEKNIRKKIENQIRQNFKLSLKLKASPKSILRYFLYMVHPIFMDIVHEYYIRRR